MRIAILGCGTLGGAIAAGLRDRPGIDAVERTTRASSSRNAGIVHSSDVVLVCVKPYDVEAVVRSVAAVLRPEHVLVTTAASVAAASVRTWSANRARVVRAMPNTAARAGAAMTVLARDGDTCERALRSAQRVFEAVGRTIVMDESRMDAATAIGGCGPAFAFVVMEALIDAAIALGIPYAHAREVVAQTVFGASALLLQDEEHPAVHKIAVATPGGRTARGLRELERGGVRAALHDAAVAAASAC